MDEIMNKISSVKRPAEALISIDQVLKSAYQAPRNFAFSADMDEKTIQKAVLYHRIMEDSSMRSGEKSVLNDIRYEELADAVIEGRDSVAEFIKAKQPREQADLLRELMVSGTKRAWFEDMLTRADEKKRERDSLTETPDKQSIQQLSSARIARESCRVQSELFKSLAENRGADPKDFFKQKENVARVRRMLAVELHRRQIDHELEELRKAYDYERKSVRAEQLKQRHAFAFEKAAGEDPEAHLKRLENSHEVLTILRRMAQSRDIEELSRAVISPPSPEYLHQHDNIALMENKLVPDAIKAFLSGKDAPQPGSEEEKALLALSAMSGKECPDNPSPKECEKRINEYSSVLKTLESGGFLSGDSGTRLKQELDGQIERLEDVIHAPYRNNIQFNFRADTLIDYVDNNYPTQRPMDAIEAREKLIRGAELEQKTFNDDDIAGVSQKISYDKKTGLVNKGPEKLITRYMNLSEKAGRKPELQLEELRKIKDLLKITDPFYVKNSDAYNNVLDSLNKVIKTQESLDRDANVRQVAELRAMYAELDSNAAKYVKDKSDRLKTGDDRAQIRMDAIKTLQSLTGEKHVGKVTLKLFDEQKKLDTQQTMVEPCKRIIEKWKKSGTPNTPEAYEDFKRDFDSLSSRFEMIQNNFEDVPYFKMGIAEGLEDFTQKAEEVQKKQQEPDKKLDQEKLNNMIKLKNEGKEALAAMEPTVPAPEKENRKSTPEKKLNNPEKVIAPL